MKKFISIVASLTFASAYTLNFHSGWQLKGALNDINISTFNNSNIKSVWTYDDKNNKWMAYFPNSNINLSKYGIEKLTKINKEDGFWVNATNSVSLDIDTNTSFIQAVQKEGLLALKDRKFYWGYIDGLTMEDDDSGYVIFSKNGDKEEIHVGDEIHFHNVTELSKDTLKEIGDDGDHNTFKLLKIDPEKELIFLYDNEGVLILSSSKEAIDKYANELDKKYPHISIDPKTLKGQYFYSIDDEKYEWIALKLEDNEVTFYKVDDIFAPDKEENYIDPWSNNIKYPGGNKLEIFDDGEWDPYYVYKYPLTDKTIDSLTLGAMFDDINIFTNKLKFFGINEVNFTKGNAYCNMAWDECWIDEDALKEIDGAFNNINVMYAIKKGDPKTPRYSKISDYLKEQPYYSVYTEDTFIDYEKDYLNNGQFCSQELQSNGDELDSDCISDMDKHATVLQEYDNGILVKISYDGIHYKQFLYNNEDDAKKVYDLLLSKY